MNSTNSGANKRTDTDRDAPPTTDRPLCSQQPDGHERTVFFEDGERARHAGQWIVAGRTLALEVLR